MTESVLPGLRHVAAARYLIPAALLTLLLLGWLILRPPFPLTALTPPAGVTATVQSGSTGVQVDERGAFWWISLPDPLVGIANNTPDPVLVDVSLRVTNGPCAVERTVQFGESSALLERARGVEISSGPVALAAYERISLGLEISAAACEPTETEPRPLYVQISELNVVEVDE